MSDDNDSGGIIGSIISIFILVALWPYFLALLGIYIAYILVIEALEWVSQHLLLVMAYSAIFLTFLLILRYGVIQKLWRSLIVYLQPKPAEVMFSKDFPPAPYHHKSLFEPSTNLYCYWCTKKLGIKAFELNGKYYCLDCNQALLNNKLDRGG